MADCIPYRKTNYFSDLICDYLEEKKSLTPFYHRFSKFENFKEQLLEKEKSYPNKNRRVLVDALEKQYKNFEISKITQQNISLLSKKNTFTVTTGHQLNLFTGPLYFLYKIVSAINLAKQLKAEYPNYHFVPVYWMASEDHDFEEINFFNFKEEKIQWKNDASGAVGELSNKGLDAVFADFSEKMNASENAEYLRELFKNAYLKHKNLAEATFFIANELFGKYGLVCLDANKRELKKLFVPQIKNELAKQTAFEKTQETIDSFGKLRYKIQVNPREINLFYLSEGIRERIIKKENKYFVNETELEFSETEILKLAENEPEKFSPNVVMRPLYQECILPNLCYIGGGGELAYWFELKAYFEAENIPFPILLLRNSALLVSEKQQKKLDKLDIPIENLFLEQSELLTRHTNTISKINIDFFPQKKYLEEQFKALYELAKETDKSFLGAVAAQEKKQTNGLAHMEKRLLKAQKRKLKTELERLMNLQDQLFPNQSLQERHDNFSTFYLEYGEQLIPKLLEELKPLGREFKIISL
ncbi:MAG TPA: bacillithiol biosynthesis cysteine-adding enzyme BshC [Flavobacteriaceae bacterium]|nr:bacillithiol biosynthesis cysteine-adding enzyme BshC [Flavobacteriaceae bacterium]